MYKETSKNIDFEHLGNWCKERLGEVIVCESDNANWLPFETFSTILNTQKKKSLECVYYQGFDCLESEHQAIAKQLTLF